MPRAGESIEEWMGALENTPDTIQNEKKENEKLVKDNEEMITIIHEMDTSPTIHTPH